MNNDKADLVLDATQNHSAKILLSTGLSINGDAEIVILNFLQSPPDANDKHVNVVARVAVTPTHLKAYIEMMQNALSRMEQARNKVSEE